MAASERFLTVLKNLSPKGRLFRIPFGSDIDKFYRAHTAEYERLAQRADLVRDSGIPGRIPLEALDDWEEFLNLPHKEGLTVQQRNERIIGKDSQVGGQGPDYIQDTLQSAGFPLYVYENSPESGARSFTSTLGSASLGSFSLGMFTDRIDPRTLTGKLYAGPPRAANSKDYTPSSLGGNTLGSFTLGQFSRTLVSEEGYSITADASRYIFFFFLAGSGGIFDFVDIPAEREEDLKRVLYEIKPGHVWVIAQINFI